ncbi:MAG: hypothetical protein KatS3mg011_1741 [Acidimicrobiia bacterium]|nr:MAG: hypothetical protein KatS3mg011_1741 [Acidimicrobiia bacterium]
MFDTYRSLARLEGDPDHRSPEPSSSLPDGLDSWQPGPELAALLSTVDVDELPAGDRVVVLRAYQRMASHMQAKVYRTMTAILDAYRELLADEAVDDEEFVYQAAAAEVGSALRLTRRTATREMTMAGDLFVRLPQVGEAMTQGKIDHRRARVLVSETAHLSETAARTVVDQVIQLSERLTTGQLAARLRRLAIQAAPEEAEKRFEHAAADRRMVVEPTCEGTADILLIGVSPDAAMAASDHVDSLARRLKTLPGETADARPDPNRHSRRPATGTHHPSPTGTQPETGTSRDPCGPHHPRRARPAPRRAGRIRPGDSRHRPSGRPHLSKLVIRGDRSPNRRGRPHRHHPATPQQRPGSPHPRRTPFLRLPRLPHAGHQVRPRPSATLLPGWAHQPREPRPPVSPPPRHPTPRRMAVPAHPRRGIPVDQPAWAHLPERLPIPLAVTPPAELRRPSWRSLRPPPRWRGWSHHPTGAARRCP